MSNQKPQIRIKLNSPIGNDLFFALPNLSGNTRSFIETDVAAGGGSLSANGTFFEVDQFVIVGQLLQGKSEIVKISAVDSTSITLDTNLVFSHNRGDVITLIEYDQLTPERSTNAGVNFSALSAVDINPQVPETYLQRSGDNTTDVYRYRFYNSESTLYSGYSDNVTATGYADNSVYAIKERALSQLGEETNELITNDFLNSSLNEGRRIVDTGSAVVDGISQRVFRWSFRTKFNTDIGSIIPGQWSIAAPTDLRDRNTYKNILSLRIGRQNFPLVYQDNRRFRQNYLNVGHTTIATAVSSGDTSLVLESSGDFNDSGNIIIASPNVSTDKDEVAYTANDLSAETLSGVTGALDHAVGTDVWQEATFGIPTAFTIDKGMIYFDIPFGNEYAGENIYLDYYQDLTPVTSDSEVVDEPVYDLYVAYLKFKIKSLKSNGDLNPMKDGDYLLFQQGLSQLVGQEVLGQNISFVPTWGGGFNSPMD